MTAIASSIASRLPAPLRRLARPLLGPLRGQEPAAVLLRRTARQEWRRLALMVGSSLLEAATEGATFGLIFLAVELLSRAEASEPVNWLTKPLLGRIPGLPAWLESLPTTPLFLGLLALAVALQALQSLSRYVGAVAADTFAARCRARITAQIHGQILRLSFACASCYRVGDLGDYAIQGPEAINKEINLLRQLLVAALLSGVYLVILLQLSPWLLLAALLLGLLIAAVQRRLLPPLRASAQSLSRIGAEIAARITEDIQGLRLLHSSGQRLAAEGRLRGRMGELEASLRRQSRLANVIGPFSAFLPVAAMAVMGALSLVVFGARSSGVLPSLITFVLALQRLNMRFSNLAGLAGEMARNAGQIERLNAILSPAGKAFVRDGGRPFEGLRQQIRLEGVELHYGGEGPAALNGIDLVIERGSTVALVGPSGAGKSSIADLLTGLYEPTRGRLLIDGTDLRQLDLGSWQRRIGVVSQDTFLFNMSLADNIAFGSEGASRGAIERAARVAHAHGFITALPQGYDTVVGERGFRLSGGQRQRIALARAILRQPELLILDEATSALDSENERLVQEAIEELDCSITRLVIAHRLGTVVHADQIVVLERGRVVQRGRHQQLVAAGGLYASLSRQQRF